MDMIIQSPVFIHQGSIPEKYTCEGLDFSPPLEWSGLPQNTKSLALIVDDPDAPDPKAPKMTYVHWVLYNIPVQIKGLAEGSNLSNLPAGIQEGMNDWQRTGYGGPCPPIGEHRYFFKLYALDVQLPDLSHPSKIQLEKAMEGHILAKAEMIGKYQKTARK